MNGTNFPISLDEIYVPAFNISTNPHGPVDHA